MNNMINKPDNHIENVTAVMNCFLNQDPDILILAKNGEKVWTHRCLLSMFSLELTEFLSSVPGWLSTNIHLPDVTAQTLIHLFNILHKGVTTNIDSITKKDVKIAAKLLGINISLNFNNDISLNRNSGGFHISNDTHEEDNNVEFGISNDVIEEDVLITDVVGEKTNNDIDQFQNIGIEIKRELDKMLTLSEIELDADNHEINNILQLEDKSNENSMSDKHLITELSKENKGVELAVAEIINSLDDLGTENKRSTSENNSDKVTDIEIESTSEDNSEIMLLSQDVTDLGNNLNNIEENIISVIQGNENKPEIYAMETDTERQIKEIFDIRTNNLGGNKTQITNGNTSSEIDLKSESKDAFTNCYICNQEFTSNPKLSLEHYFNHFSSEAKSTYGHLVKDDGACKICSKKRVHVIQHIAITHKKMREIFDKNGIPYPNKVLSEPVSGIKRKIESLDTEIDNTSTEATTITPKDVIDKDTLNEFVCKVCQSPFSNISSLMTHCSNHFQNELKKKYGNLISSDGKCKQCGKIIKWKNQIKHLGVTHRYIYELLEEKFGKDFLPVGKVHRFGNNYVPESSMELALKNPDSKGMTVQEYSSGDSIKYPEKSSQLQMKINNIKDSLTHIKSEPIDNNIKSEPIDDNINMISETMETPHYIKAECLEPCESETVSNDNDHDKDNNKNNTSISESKKNSSKEDFSCKLCTVTLENTDDLLGHYSKHYYRELQGEFGHLISPDGHCKECNNKINGPLVTQMMHLGAAHKKILPIIMKLLEKSTNQESKKDQNNEHEKVYNESQKAKQEILNAEKHVCLICGIVIESLTELKFLIHYCKHFKKILKSQVVNFYNNNSECKQCGKKFSINKLTTHMGATHKKLWPILTSELGLGGKKKQNLIVNKHKEKLSNVNSPSIEQDTISKTNNVKEESKSFNVKIENKLSCPNCPLFLENREDLIEHLCRSHFKNAILEKYGNIKNHCEECNKIFENTDEFATHIGYFHCKLVEFSTVSGTSQTKQKTQTNINMEENKKEICEEAMANNAPKIDSELTEQKDYENCKLSCFQCENSYVTREDLYQHYSYAHYSSQLMEMFGIQSACNMTNCSDTFAGVANWINHIGEVHEMVEQFIPKQHQISKTK